MTVEGKSDHLRIGVLTPLVAGGYYGGVISGIARTAMARGARTIAIQTLDLSYGGAYAAAEAAVPRFAVRAAWDQAAGFIVLLNAVEPWYLQAMRDAGRPVVLLSSEVPGFVCPVARPDNRTGVTQAVAHLVAHGHRRIAFAGSFIQSDIRERLDAYREALTLNGIEPDDALVFEADDNLAVGGEAAARRMLAAGLPSTAVIAGTDYNALAIMGALSEAGLSLPDDQAIVGFDDVEAGASARPTLSTIHQRFDETAGLAADLLLDLIAGEEVASGDHRLPSLFVPRESCGCNIVSTVEEMIDPSDLVTATAKEQLTRRLGRALVGPDPSPEQRAALRSAVELVAGFAEAGEDSAAQRRDRFCAAARCLWSVSPRWTTTASSVACLRRYQAELTAAGLAGPDPQEFASGIVDFVVELAGCLTTREADMRNSLHLAMGQDHDLSMSLVRGQASDLTSLGWIAHTPARAGCIGLWSSGSRTRAADRHLLTIAGSYVRGGASLVLPDQLRVEEFPATSLLENLEWDAGEVAVVLPAKTATSDLGLLAMVTGIEAVGGAVRDRLFETVALLSLSVEREEMTEKLRRSNADLATFSHAMAHDLRNPLATISMWASVARARAGPGDDAEPVLRIVDQIKQVSAFANELVSDLLRYAELDRVAAPRQPVDLNLATGRALATLESTIVEHGAVVEAGDLPTVRGNFAELELVLQNLIENAIKHRAGRAPRIRIDAVRDDGGWTIRCHDNGAGIPTALRNRVFEPFVRGETPTAGSGLGLATCRRIVQGLGGRIWVDQSGVNGTTIALNLPTASDVNPSSSPTRALPAAPE
ncbi:MAG: substrate-binding domain-containing protein, partial [Candidatus Dormiibacterota bacterium]